MSFLFQRRDVDWRVSVSLVSVATQQESVDALKMDIRKLHSVTESKVDK